MSFKTLFHHDANVVLNILSKGFGNGLYPEVSRNPSVTFMDSCIININSLAVIYRAILSFVSVEIEYYTQEESTLSLTIFPHTLFEGYRGWYVRAFNTPRKQYQNFSLLHILNVKAAEQLMPMSDVRRNDSQWNEQINLRLEPHRTIKNISAIETMFNMSNGELVIHTNRVLAIHVLKTLNVELCKQKQNCSKKFYLSLLNTDELEGIELLFKE